MSTLARKTLLREWNRFFPAIMAIAFAGLLLVAQAGLVLGIFGSASVYINQSSANFWLGYPGTQSVNLGRNISNDLMDWVRTLPGVDAVEPMLWLDADWRSRRGGVSISVIGLNPTVHGLLFDQILNPALRSLLTEPGAIIVDRADLDELAASSGGLGWINQHPVHIVAMVHGLRALGGVNILASLETTRWLANDPTLLNNSTYILGHLHNPQLLGHLLSELNRRLASFGPHAAWAARTFAHRSQMFWLLDTGAGVAVLFLASIVFVVCAVIASQSLTAIVISASREYATLNALGASMGALRLLVFEQSLWVGGIGLLLGSILASVLFFVARWHDVPVEMNLQVALGCAMLVLLLALVSGLLAMRGLMRADPARLLR